MRNFDKNLHLVFMKEVGKSNGIDYEYDMYFSKTPDEFWGVGFDCEFAGHEEAIPDEKTYDTIIRLKTTIPFFCMQKNRCFSMMHMVNGVVAVAFEDISDYGEYPEPYRLVFKYGETLDSIEEKLAARNQVIGLF